MKDYIGLKEITGILNVMQLAATESSQSTSMLSILCLAERKDLQQTFEEINARVYDEAGITNSKTLDADPVLNLWMKETLRLNISSGNASIRIATRDVKLKDITVKAGDGVILLNHSTKLKAQSFEDPNEFKLDRFEKKINHTTLQYQYFPFFAGKRACPGRNLGELMVKLSVSHICRMFEFRKVEG